MLFAENLKCLSLTVNVIVRRRRLDRVVDPLHLGLDPGRDPGLDHGLDPGLDLGPDPGLDLGLDPGLGPVPRVFSCSENWSNAPNSEQTGKVLRICFEFAFSYETLRVQPC